jgi:hypothetical protein
MATEPHRAAPRARPWLLPLLLLVPIAACVFAAAGARWTPATATARR